jgi:hypothetical protein
MDEFYEFFKGFIRSIRSFVKFVVILKPCIEQPGIEYLLLRQSLRVQPLRFWKPGRFFYLCDSGKKIQLSITGML